jgi:hypothetical protein
MREGARVWQGEIKSTWLARESSSQCSIPLPKNANENRVELATEHFDERIPAPAGEPKRCEENDERDASVLPTV